MPNLIYLASKCAKGQKIIKYGPEGGQNHKIDQYFKLGGKSPTEMLDKIYSVVEEAVKENVPHRKTQKKKDKQTTEDKKQPNKKETKNQQTIPECKLSIKEAKAVQGAYSDRSDTAKAPKR
jgi:uncharacterized protein YcnI